MAEIDRDTLKNLQWKIMQNVAAGAIIPLMRIGDELGLFLSLAECGPCSIGDFAKHAGIDSRYAEEWILAMCAAGYCSFSEELEEFHLSPEQEAVFAREESPALMIGAYDILAGNVHNIEKLLPAFKSGQGVEWGNFHPCIFQGTARFFKPSYESNLLQRWLPKIPLVAEKLERGGSFLDVGCGQGISTLLIASAYPIAEINGLDPHAPSIEKAKEAAAASMLERVNFFVSDAESYEKSYDVIAFFDCLHDMGDPLAAAQYARSKLKKGGVAVLIEPSASDEKAENLNIIGQMYYSFSTMGCVPASKSQKVGLALGAQAGAKKLTDIMESAGFASFEIVFKNPTNMVIACYTD